MCGICGIAMQDPAARPDADTLRGMADVIAHRGPDDFGLEIAGPVGLAMRRLSIIDVEHGQQPIHNEDGSIRLVFNGELYNYRELGTTLRKRGHVLRTNADSEVVVHAFEEWGTGCLDRFRGMFALALWDERRGRLLLAVDRFGIKPLYVAPLDGELVFGSELGAIVASGRPVKELDDDALAEYFTLGYIPPPATIFRRVRKLEPGTLLEWTPRAGAELRRWWEVPAVESDQAREPEGLRRDVRELLRDAVRSHLVSDVPVGAFLSGGIDSSSVVALMSEVSEEPVRTFSIGFAAREHDERPRARLVAQRFGTDHRELVVEPESLDVLPKLVAHFQEPFADSSALPTYFVSRLASESVKVALSGDGGDELFVGYTTFRGVEAARLAQSLPGPARRALGSLPRRLPLGSSDRAHRWRKWAADTALPPEAAYRSKITMAGLPLVRPLLTGDLQRRLNGHDPFGSVDRALAAAPGGTPLERVLHAGLKVSLPGDMLVKVDRMSMANSLEVRVPLLDHVLAEYLARLPVPARFPRWRLKALLKDTMSDVLPPAILEQPKHGFTVPLAAWFRGDVADFAAQILVSAEVRDRGFVDPAAVERLLREHERGGGDFGRAIWVLLVFELWCRELLD